MLPELFNCSEPLLGGIGMGQDDESWWVWKRKDCSCEEEAVLFYISLFYLPEEGTF